MIMGQLWKYPMSFVMVGAYGSFWILYTITGTLRKLVTKLLRQERKNSLIERIPRFISGSEEFSLRDGNKVNEERNSFFKTFIINIKVISIKNQYHVL